MVHTQQPWVSGYPARHGAGFIGQPQPSIFGDDAETVYRLVSTRMRLFMLRQVEETWRRRDHNPLAPVGLGFLYLQRGRVGLEVVAGTRMFLENEDVADAASVVRDLTTVGRTLRDAHGRLDPVASMCTGNDGVCDGAVYIGTVVSTMDVAAPPWEVARRGRDEQPYGVRARALVLLADATMMDVGHVQQGYLADYVVRCSAPSRDSAIGVTGRRWAPDLPELGDPVTRAIWLELNELHALAMGPARPHAGARGLPTTWGEVR